MKDYICYDIFDLRNAPKITKRTIETPATVTPCDIARAYMGKSLLYTATYTSGRRAYVNIFGTNTVALVVSPVPRIVGNDAEKAYKNAVEEWGGIFDVVPPEKWRGEKCYY